MKRVLIEVPDNVDSSLIFYRDGDSFRYVNPKVVDEFPIQLNAMLSEEDIEKSKRLLREGMWKSSVAPYGLMVSRKEFEALRSRVEKLEVQRKKEAEAFLAVSIRPTAEEGLKAVGLSDKDIEELRSRVEKLERESERQCARVIKMEEGISDDLK